MSPAYESTDDTIQFIRRYDQLLLAAIRTRAIVKYRLELITLASELDQVLVAYVPPPIRVNLFYERCLNCLWDLVNYIHEYLRQCGGQRADVYELYQLKHRLLERMIVLADSCSGFAWEVGRSTDRADIMSVRLIYHTVDGRRRAKRLHWPTQAVPLVVQEIIRQRYGNFPPPDVLVRDD